MHGKQVRRVLEGEQDQRATATIQRARSLFGSASKLKFYRRRFYVSFVNVHVLLDISKRLLAFVAFPKPFLFWEQQKSDT